MTSERLKELNEIEKKIKSIKENIKILDYAERLRVIETVDVGFLE